MSCCVRTKITLKNTGGKKIDSPSLSLKLRWIWLRDGRAAGIHKLKSKCCAWKEEGEERGRKVTLEQSKNICISLIIEQATQRGGGVTTSEVFKRRVDVALSDMV